MMYVCKPSLEHIAGVKIVVTLWNQIDVRALLKEYILEIKSEIFIYYNYDRWEIIERSVKEKVKFLNLPEILKEKIMSFINPIGIQIFNWIRHHCKSHQVCENLPKQFFWTPQGTINNKKTALMLIKDEDIIFQKRFTIACIYYLEDIIKDMWDKIPENPKENFIVRGTERIGHYHTWVYWIKKLRKPDGVSFPSFSHETMFNSCAINDMKEGVEYFLTKISLSTRENLLLKTAISVENADILCLLFSQMDREQQTNVFKSNPLVIEHFLEWPYQSLFFEVANFMWEFLTEEKFSCLMELILRRLENSYNNYNYKSLIINLWLKSSDDYKRYFIGEIRRLSMLHAFLSDVEKRGYLYLFLQNMSLSGKEELFFCSGAQNTFVVWFIKEKWDLFEVFIDKCFSSKDEVIKFKNEFEKHLMENFLEDFKKNKHRWNELFTLFN